MRKTKAEAKKIHERVLDLWAAGLTSPEIQDRVPGATEKSISNCLWRARKNNDPRAALRIINRAKNLGSRPWTDSELMTAIEMKQISPRTSFAEIGAKIGRTARSVEAKLKNVGWAGKFERPFPRDGVVSIPETVEDLRTHRLSLSPRDLTAAYFGDPLPGFSALDRRVAV